MAHTFLSLDMNLIPQSTKDNVLTFWGGLFSNDKTRMLIDGKDHDGDMVHPMQVLRAWTQWESNPDEVIEILLSDAVEMTANDYFLMRDDVGSIWYIEGKA